MTRIACLVAAAGGASRFDGTKQLSLIEGKPMVVHTLSKLTPLFGDHLYTVVGAFRDQVVPLVENLSQVIEHASWQSGLGASIARGVSEICDRRRYDGLMIALADQVAIRQSDYQHLIDHFGNERIVASNYAGRIGVPAIFPHSFFYALGQLSGDQGARHLLSKNASVVHSVSMPNAEIDIDTRRDLSNLDQQLAAKYSHFQ